MEINSVDAVVAGLSKQGYLLDLTVSRWAGQARLSEADLGLEGLTDSDLHRLGRRQLVPAEALARITRCEQRARSKVTDVSYTFPLGGARFVPVKLLGGLLAALDEIRTQFVGEVEAFCADYATLSEKTRGEWRENALRIKAQLGKDDAWLSDFEARLASAYPSVEKVRASFKLEWSLYQFALPQGLQAQVVNAADATEAARLAGEAKRRVEAQVSAFVGEAAMELRNRASELCRHVAQQINKSGDKVSERTLEPLREMIAQFKSLDFTGDADFAAHLDKLQKEWLGSNKGTGIAKDLRENADYRKAMADALGAVADGAVADADKAASEALDRFLRLGGAGRAVVVSEEAEA